jgi:hypothetical protein
MLVGIARIETPLLRHAVTSSTTSSSTSLIVASELVSVDHNRLRKLETLLHVGGQRRGRYLRGHGDDHCLAHKRRDVSVRKNPN